jgi:hypothetical protein
VFASTAAAIMSRSNPGKILDMPVSDELWDEYKSTPELLK